MISGDVRYLIVADRAIRNTRRIGKGSSTSCIRAQRVSKCHRFSFLPLLRHPRPSRLHFRRGRLALTHGSEMDLVSN